MQRNIASKLESGIKDIHDDPFKLKTDGTPVKPMDIIDPGFIDIARLEAGGSFGELALLDGKPRMATIKCLQRCHFFIISKNLYEKSLDEIERKRLNAQINYVKSIPLFSKMTRTSLGKLLSNFKNLDVNKDCYLYKEGDPADRVYIVRDGEFVVTKK